jgi:hypothetical protein
MSALRAHKATPVPPGYVRRTGPTACQVMPRAGMHLEDLLLLRRCGLIYGRVLPYRVDVSLDLWSRFITQNWKLGDDPRHCTAAGDYMAPDDAAAFLSATADSYPHPKGHGPHMTSI